jgi:hypothetical protein
MGFTQNVDKYLPHMSTSILDNVVIVAVVLPVPIEKIIICCSIQYLYGNDSFFNP